jgi:hypothetical protein
MASTAELQAYSAAIAAHFAELSAPAADPVLDAPRSTEGWLTSDGPALTTCFPGSTAAQRNEFFVNAGINGGINALGQAATTVREAIYLMWACHYSNAAGTVDNNGRDLIDDVVYQSIGHSVTASGLGKPVGLNGAWVSAFIARTSQADYRVIGGPFANAAALAALLLELA